MRVAVTGANGFLGWHIRSRLFIEGHDWVAIGRDVMADVDQLDAVLGDVDAVIHAAGVNRAPTDQEIVAGNLRPAKALAASLDRISASVPVVFANSIQPEHGSAYSEAKDQAADLLLASQAARGAVMADLVLPHLFGEYGRPFYNSAVTTFAHCLAVHDEPQVNRNGRVELVHAQEVAVIAIAAAQSTQSRRERIAGRSMAVGDTWDLLAAQHRRYVDEFTIPAFADRFELQMFNMLRSHLYLNGYYPRPLTVHQDDRGGFAELGRADGLGQTSISTSGPGISRGDHFHLDKIERFVVVGGSATIRMRRILTDEINTFEVSGDAPVYIDMPPLTTHNITNTGPDTMTTIFWAGDHFDPATPDTYVDRVQASDPVQVST